MLLTPPGTICSLKLVNGDELIGKLVKNEMLNYTISRPLVCILTPQGMALTQWMMTADIDQEFLIPNNVVLNMSKTRKEVADEYVRSTTGIKPSSGSILT